MLLAILYSLTFNPFVPITLEYRNIDKKIKKIIIEVIINFYFIKLAQRRVQKIVKPSRYHYGKYAYKQMKRYYLFLQKYIQKQSLVLNKVLYT